MVRTQPTTDHQKPFLPMENAGSLFWLNPALRQEFEEVELSSLLGQSLREGDQQAVQSALRFIASSRPEGEAFFGEAAGFLQRLLGTAYVVIARVQDTIIHTLAAQAPDHRMKNFQITAVDDPFAELLREGGCFYPANLPQTYPHVPYLIRLEIESFLGLPLRSARNEIIGLAAVLHTGAMERPEFVLKILRILVPRLARELDLQLHPEPAPVLEPAAQDLLQRQRQELNQTRSLLHSILRLSSEAFVIINQHSQITLFNQPFADLFGLHEDSLPPGAASPLAPVLLLLQAQCSDPYLCRNIQALIDRQQDPLREMRFALRDGRQILLSVFLNTEEGRQNGQILHFREITSLTL